MSGASVFLRWQILKIGFSIFTTIFFYQFVFQNFHPFLGPALISILIENRLFPLLLLLLLSRFSRVRLCATPQTAAHQAPPSLGFSRQEYWSGLPLPSLLFPLVFQKCWCGISANIPLSPLISSVFHIFVFICNIINFCFLPSPGVHYLKFLEAAFVLFLFSFLLFVISLSLSLSFKNFINFFLSAYIVDLFSSILFSILKLCLFFFLNFSHIV